MFEYFIYFLGGVGAAHIALYLLPVLYRILKQKLKRQQADSPSDDISDSDKLDVLLKAVKDLQTHCNRREVYHLYELTVLRQWVICAYDEAMETDNYEAAKHFQELASTMLALIQTYKPQTQPNQ